LTRDNESLRYKNPENTRPARAWNIDSLERRMVANLIGCFAMRDLPQNFALVQINRADASVWRFRERQTLNGECNSACLAARCSRCSGRCAGEAPDERHV